MKTTLALTFALLVALTTSAQDWAKARLDKSPRHQEWVKVKHDNREVDCFMVYLTSPGAPSPSSMAGSPSGKSFKSREKHPF